MIWTSYKIKFTTLGSLIFPCLCRINLHGTNFEHDLYRYLLPFIVGGLSGYFIGLMKDKWLITNQNLQKTNEAMKQEIKEHKLSRQALQKSKGQSKRYIEAIDSMGIGIFIVDSDYHIRHMNETMIKWFGDHTGSNCHQAVVGLDSPCTYCKLRPVIESNKIVHYMPTTPDGRSFDIMCYPIQNSDGSISKMEVIRDITVEKKAEDILRESEERFRKIIEDVSEISIQGYDEERRVTFWNQASEKLYGYTEQDALGNKLEDLIIPLNMQKEVKKLHDRWLEYGEEIPAGELKLIDNNGNDVPVFSSHVMHETRKGKEIFCIDIDLKPIRQAEEALRESEEKYRALIETTDTGYLILDKAGKVIDANAEYIRLSGHQTIDEILGRSVVEWTAPHDYERNAQEVKKCMEKGYVKNLEIDYINKDGKITPVEINAKIVSTDKGFRILSLCQDITKRKQAEAALHKSEEKFRLIAETSIDGIYQLDDQGNVIYYNNSLATFLGYTIEEAIGKHFLDFTDEQHQTFAMELFDKLNEGKILKAEILVKHKSGNSFPVLSSMVPLFEKGKLVIITGILRDITERKRAEEEKIKAQKLAGEQKKLALIGQVAGKMAHDFNNILGIIMGNTELALMDCEDGGIKKTLDLIFQQTMRGKNLTKNLVAFAREQEPKQEFFKISDKIDLVLNLMKKDLQGISLIKDDESNVPDLLADPGMIEHALVNIIQNSIHAISMSDNPKIILRTYCLHEKICFEVEDNGCGIPKKHLEKIYDPSFTLKGSKDVTSSYKAGIKGTGYGLSNVKKYIEQHKGNITIESEFESGTKFTISLPVIKKELTRQEKEEIQQEKIFFDKSILLVEDEPAISDVQYRILTQKPCNHKVDIAQNGQIAMDLFKRNEYDFISLDYVLPGKINGMDVYNYIRKTDKNIPILFVSGNIEFLESIKDLKHKDINIDHLSKPCQNKDYVSSINKLLGKTSTGQ